MKTYQQWCAECDINPDTFSDREAIYNGGVMEATLEAAELVFQADQRLSDMINAATKIVNLVSDDDSRYEMWKEEIEALSDACRIAELDAV